jgi:serine/threonine protein kinase
MGIYRLYKELDPPCWAGCSRIVCKRIGAACVGRSDFTQWGLQGDSKSMMLLPKTVGPLTLLRKMGSGGVAESYEGVLNGPEEKRVRVRRVLPYILADKARLTSVEARVRDLIGAKHPFLLPVLQWVEIEDERFIVEEWTDRIDLEKVLAYAKKHDRPLPENVFLNLAAQICNGLEALHGRPGRGTGAENILHLGLRPGACWVDSEGQVALGAFALLRSPLALPSGGEGPIPMRFEYLSPEQTHSAQKLTPASDVFTLGALLYELFTLKPLFKAGSKDQTVQQLRRAEVTSQLLKVKERMPGLDKVLFRALSVNPRHRYQRAFVLREDLRGLMAGYSFSTISRDSALYLSPLFADQNQTAPQILGDGPPLGSAAGFTESATRIDADPTSTAAFASKAAQERAQAEAQNSAEADEWADESNTELKTLPPVIEQPLVPILDQDSEEISLIPEKVEAQIDVVEDSLDTDLGLQAIFPPGGAESTLGFVSSPQTPHAQAHTPVPTGRSPVAADTQFEALMDHEAPTQAPPSPFSPKKTPSLPTPPAVFTPVVSAPADPPGEVTPPIPMNWDDEISAEIGKRKSSNPLGMALAGFGAAALILVGLKLGLQKDDESPAIVIQPDLPAEILPVEAEPEVPEALELIEEPEIVAEAEAKPATRRKRTTYTPPKQNYEAVTYYPKADPVPEPDETEEDALERVRTDVSMYLVMAESGHLTQDHVYDLEGIGTDDDSYTQARALLLINAEKAKNGRNVKKYLDQLFYLDENRYNPVFLSKRARWYANNRKYDRALADAQKAEQHWARIPPTLVFETKAEIFEVQAASLQGLFYKSEDDTDLLDKAIRGWTKYARHVDSRREDLGNHAQAQIKKLDYARKRLR